MNVIRLVFLLTFTTIFISCNPKQGPDDSSSGSGENLNSNNSQPKEKLYFNQKETEYHLFSSALELGNGDEIILEYEINNADESGNVYVKAILRYYWNSAPSGNSDAYGNKSYTKIEKYGYLASREGNKLNIKYTDVGYNQNCSAADNLMGSTETLHISELKSEPNVYSFSQDNDGFYFYDTEYFNITDEYEGLFSGNTLHSTPCSNLEDMGIFDE